MAESLTATRFPADCSECTVAQRCWGGAVPAGAGFRVRRQVCGKAGERFYAQGDTFAAVYLVRTGCLKLVESSADGSERVAGFRLPGELVGLEGLDSGRYPHRAEALVPGSVCRLQWTVAGDGSRHPQLLQRVLTKAVRQWCATERPWAGLSAPQQVAAFIEDFAVRSASDELPMTRADIGSYLGLAEETVVRALKTHQVRSSGTAKSL